MPVSDLRTGISRTEVIVVSVCLLVLVAVTVPAILAMRERSRQTICQSRMAAVTAGMLAYHERHGVLPSAATWSTAELQTLALHQSKRWDMFVKENWAVSLLSDINRADLAKLHDSTLPISAEQNTALRSTRLEELVCPADELNTSENLFTYSPNSATSIEFARGNFAINGGTHSFHTTEGSTSTPTGDHANLLIDPEKREFTYWGNGVAGINRSFSLKDFTNGPANLVAINEIRSGVSADDLRGSWALGHIAASVTWGHGVNGDCSGPNNLWARSDDIQGCSKLHQTLGTEELTRLEMPCVSYLDENQNAGSRSRHRGGVNAAFLDGSVRFISNEIDPSLWHVIHSRETPETVFGENFATELQFTGSSEDARFERSPSDTPDVANSIGMGFVSIPAGTFKMGVPDAGNDTDTPPETPPHDVAISKPFLMAVTEVTVAQFERVMNSEVPDDTPGDDNAPNRLPVVDVTWNESVEFCRRLEMLESEKSAGRHYRLPTEAEWEYACRSGSSEPRRFSWSRQSNDDSGAAAGIQPALPLTPVKSYPANSFGLYDMRGNAWEWCSDWFDRDYYFRSPGNDPAGPEKGFIKVVRGSDWVYVGEGCFINYPMLAPWKKSPVIGFRVVCE